MNNKNTLATSDEGSSAPVYDVLVIGGGHAGLTAAICAAEAGASVCVLEGAPHSHRGGNSRHTRNLRAMHETPTDVLTEAYPEDEYWQDLLRVTQGRTNEQLARMAIRQSAESVAWLQQHGVYFQPALGGTLQLGRTNAFFMGGGKAVMNALYRAAARLGVDVHYDAPVTGLDFNGNRFEAASVGRGDAVRTIRARALVASAGGFEANLAWLAEAWGDTANNFLIRGTPYNTGEVLKMLLASGAQQVGDPKQCHAVAIDGRAPKFDGGIVTRVDCVSLGVVVNINAERFYDEGEDFWPKRYAIWGRLVAAQPEQLAHVIIDAKSRGSFIPPVFPPESADSIPALAVKIGVDPYVLDGTIRAFNAAVRPGTFDHTQLDDCRTEGLAIDKTHWARAIDQPPFEAYSLRPGITFTYLGVAVNERARMLMTDGAPSANVFAAGEIMAGNVLGEGYLAGIGMTIGGVFGRIAGQQAAAHARN
jgi:tricarballylate dehydrogenase